MKTDPPVPEALARLPDELARTGTTPEAFAARLGVSPRTLRHWRAGTRNPSGSAAILLASEFDRLRKEPTA